jgi:hypothetical protein
LVISDEDLEDTTLSWRLIDNERNSRCMCRLDDDSNVKNMVKHVTRVADGFVEIFAVSPDELLTRNTHISSLSKAACHDELLTRNTDLNEHVIKLCHLKLEINMHFMHFDDSNLPVSYEQHIYVPFKFASQL